MIINKIVSAFLIVFIVIVVIILGGAVFYKQQDSVATSTTISLAEMAKHNSASDCWLEVDGKVYNVTDYIYLHPAGPDKIIPFCGKDASVAFDTRGGRGPHSQKSQDVLNKYYVGNLTR